ncbi:MAG: hypothetical protein KAW52_07805 [candidate division Zixibacteria bacterium]|nr:hypothetical protein [candidate division Zixibacteria bacterium]
MNKKIAGTEIEEIRKQVEKEFPEDPALQEVHIARKFIAKEAELAGMSYIEFIRLWKKQKDAGIIGD